MSRSRRRPYHSVCVNESSEKKNKKIHNHRLRMKRKRFIFNIEHNLEGDFADIGIKKQEGLSLYLFNSDGGHYWMGYLKEISPEDYKRILRK